MMRKREILFPGSSLETRSANGRLGNQPRPDEVPSDSGN